MALGLDKSSLWSLEWDFVGHSITLASAEHPLQECSSLRLMNWCLSFLAFVELSYLAFEFFGLALVDIVSLGLAYWCLIIIVISREHCLTHTRE